MTDRAATRQDLADLGAVMARSIESGFDRQDERLADLRDRLADGDARFAAIQLTLGEHGAKLDAQRRDIDTLLNPPPVEGADKPVRHWDVILVAGLLSVLAALLKFFHVQLNMPPGPRP